MHFSNVVVKTISSATKFVQKNQSVMQPLGGSSQSRRYLSLRKNMMSSYFMRLAAGFF